MSRKAVWSTVLAYFAAALVCQFLTSTNFR